MRFKVGDVVVFARARGNGLPYVGRECTIMALTPRVGDNIFNGLILEDGDYLVDIPSGNSQYGIVDDWQLDPKRPPLGSWEDIQEAVGWSPVKTKENA